MYSKITKIGLFFLFICCCISNASAQTVQKIGDKPFEVAKSAVFELESKTKGFLPPRMTTGERDLILTPAVGLVIYNTSTNALEINTGTTVLPVWSSVKGYLPLTGGTMTGTVGVNGATLTLNTDTAETNTNTTTIGGGLGTGTITLGGTATQAINIGTGATGTDLKTITIGSTNAASATTIKSGSGNLSLTPAETGKIVIGRTDGTGDITLGSSNVAQTTKIGAGTGTGISKVYIGTNHAGGTGGSEVYIGNTTSSVSNYPSTVSIASGGSSNTVLLGGSSGASTTTIQSGSSGSINLMPYGDGKIVIGKSDGYGNITLGSSTDSQTTNIGTGTGVSKVNIATGSDTKANLVTIGGGLSQVGVGGAPVTYAALAVTSTTKGFLPPRMDNAQRDVLGGITTKLVDKGMIIFNTTNNALEVNTGVPGSPAWTGLSNSYLPLAGGTMTNTAVIQGAPLKLNFDAGTNATIIGGGTTEGAITLGGTGIQAINIGNGAAAKTVVLGSTNTTSATTIQSGTGTLSLTPTGTGKIVIGKSDGSGDITLGSSSAAQITNIGTGNGGSIVYITKASGDNSVVIGGDKTSATAALQINSYTKGFLPPRMTTVQRDLIGAKVSEGLIVYNTSTRVLEVNKAYANFEAQWNPVGTGVFLPLAGGTMESGSVIQGSALKLNDGTTPANTTDIGVGATTGYINLGGTATQAINIGTGATGTDLKTITIGSTNAASATTIQSGSGNLSLTPAATGPVVIGNAVGTGTITLGESSDVQTTNIGTGAGISTVKIATGSAANLVTIGSSLSQVGVGAAPVAYAALAVTSTTKGFLPPRMDNAQRDVLGGITTKLVDKGMIIFNTTNNALEVNTGVPGSPAWTGLSNSYLPLAGGTMTNTAVIQGAPLKLNFDAGTNATIIGGGTTEGAITLGGTGIQAINIGNGAAEKTVVLGSTNTTSATTIQSGTGTLSLTPAATGNIVIGNAAGTGTITLGSSSGSQTTNIGVGTGSTYKPTINIGTRIGGGSAGSAINIGNVHGTEAYPSTVRIASGAGANSVYIATGGGDNTVEIGGPSGTGTTTIYSGKALKLLPDTGSTSTVTIGNSAGKGTITLGESSDVQTTNIGTGAGISTVKIATGSAANLVTIGSSASQVGVGAAPVAYAALAVTSTTKGFLPPRMDNAQRDVLGGITTKLVDKGMIIFNTTNNALEVNTGVPGAPAWTGLSNSYLPLAGGTMTGDIKGSLLTLNSDAGTNATSIGGGSTAGPITLGGTGTQIINIGTGTGTKTVSLGSDASTSATTIKSGSAALTLTPAADIAGTIVIGNSAGLGPITLGSSSAAQTTNVGVATSTGVSTVNIGTGGSGNNVVTLGSATSQTIVGGAATGTKAALEINSTTKGFLPPRMTTDLRAGLGTKVDQGMVIYNTSTKALEVNTADIADNAVWISVGAVSNPAIIAKTGNYTLESKDSTVLFTTGGSLTATLPAASTALTGKIFFIRKDDNSTNTLTISPALKLSGVTTTVVLNYAKTIKVQCDGTNWIIIDNF